MKIIKPTRISPLTRCYRLGGKEHLGISALMMSSIDGTPMLESDSAMWDLLAAELSGQGVDMSFPKAHAEFLVTGYAFGRYAPDPAAPVCRVSASIAGLEKTLRVSGDRYWTRSGPSDPVPFDRLPLDWARAFGGEGCPENPRGRGAAASRPLDSAEVNYLPNIEYPEHPLRSPAAYTPPACFQPVAVDLPQRARLYGEPDQRWLEEDFPGFPSTFDVSYFNCAPPDQQFPELAELPPAAPFELLHMHPGNAVLRGQLPGLRARCFICRGASEHFEEIPMRLTTAWFFPHRERVLLISHGVTDIEEFDAKDISRLMLGADEWTRPRASEHYHQVLAFRTSDSNAALHALRDAELLPQWTLPGGQALEHVPSMLHQNLGRRAGMSADVAPVPQPGDLLELVTHHEALASEKRAALERLRKESAGAAGAFGHAGCGSRMAMRAGALQGISRGDVRAMPGGEGRDDFEQEAHRRLRDLYLQSAHFMEPGVMPDPAAAKQLRQRVLAARASGDSLAGAELGGADLSRLDLHSVDLSGATLDGADLSGADLSGAMLVRTVLVRARLTGTRLCKAVLREANLSRMDCGSTDFTGADLTGAIVHEARLRYCDLTGAILDGIQFRHCSVRASVFAEAILSNLMFVEHAFDDVDFSRAVVRKALFLRCSLHDVRFSSACIEGLGLVETQVRGVLSFDHASLVKTCFVKGSGIAHADFSGARLREVNLRAVNASHANFSGALITASDFTDADLSGANLRRADVRDGRFVRVDFSGADLRECDLMSAFMRGSVLRGADLRWANLFRANLSETRTDGATRWDNAYLERAMFHPRAREVDS